jgi:hypothetical protein
MASKKGAAAATLPFRGYWDDTEEQALRDAVQKHGIGAWEKMRHDVEFKVLKCVQCYQGPPPSRIYFFSHNPQFVSALHVTQDQGTQGQEIIEGGDGGWVCCRRVILSVCPCEAASHTQRVHRSRHARRLGFAAAATSFSMLSLPSSIHPVPTKNKTKTSYRGRTGVQLKDKWRNLIKFQHLRRGEAESAPYKAGARVPGAGVDKRKKSDDER